MTGMDLVEQVAGRHPSGGRDGGPLAFARPVGTAGFTLMEMLVTLVLVLKVVGVVLLVGQRRCEKS